MARPPGEASCSFSRLVAHLRRRLAAPLPGPAAQQMMAPSSRPAPSLQQVAEATCREAGVLALLFPDDDRATLVLTQRHEDLPDHPGQISFPGGQREEDETLCEAALREAKEEISLETEGVEVLGELSPLYIPPSGFCVYPFVAALEYPPALHPGEAEVEAILHVPVHSLLEPTAAVREEWLLQDRLVNVPLFAIEEHQIWGATAMILAELLALIDKSFCQ